jgi:hypothetical protein
MILWAKIGDKSLENDARVTEASLNLPYFAQDSFNNSANICEVYLDSNNSLQFNLG